MEPIKEELNKKAVWLSTFHKFKEEVHVNFNTVNDILFWVIIGCGCAVILSIVSLVLVHYK
jgi:hypothetical protein